MDKKCINCLSVKPLDMFYKHPQMSDGRLGKCIMCCRSKAKEEHHEKSKNTEWVDKQRARHRDKYRRLNYKDGQKKWDKNKPWKNTPAYKGLSKRLKVPKGIEIHHWCYLDESLKDVVLMDIKSHKRFHQLITLDLERRMFKIKENGEYLDTREKHLSFITESGFTYSEYSKNINYKLP